MPGLTPQKFAPERSQGLPTEQIPSATGEPRRPLLALLRCASRPHFGTEGVPSPVGCPSEDAQLWGRARSCCLLPGGPWVGVGALGGCQGPAPTPNPGSSLETWCSPAPSREGLCPALICKALCFSSCSR